MKMGYLFIKLLQKGELLLQQCFAITKLWVVATKQNVKIQLQYPTGRLNLLGYAFTRQHVANIVVDVEVGRKQPFALGFIKHYHVWRVARCRDDLELVVGCT